jgi:hypothetical protein
MPGLLGTIYRNSLLSFTGITTVNKEMYVDLLRCLRDAVKRNRPEKWRTNSWFLLHDDASHIGP